MALNLSFTVSPRNFGKYEARLGRKVKPMVLRITRQWGRDTVRELRTDTARRNVVHKRRFLRGWVAKRVNWHRMRVYNRAKHAIYIEAGRRKGAKMPPARVIVRWAREKGILAKMARGRTLSRKQETALVYPIRRAIAKRGIPAKKFVTSLRFRMRQQKKLERMVRSEFEKALRGAR